MKQGINQLKTDNHCINLKHNTCINTVQHAPVTCTNKQLTRQKPQHDPWLPARQPGLSVMLHWMMKSLT